MALTQHARPALRALTSPGHRGRCLGAVVHGLASISALEGAEIRSAPGAHELAGEGRGAGEREAMPMERREGGHMGGHCQGYLSQLTLLSLPSLSSLFPLSSASALPSQPSLPLPPSLPTHVMAVPCNRPFSASATEVHPSEGSPGHSGGGRGRTARSLAEAVARPTEVEVS